MAPLLAQRFQILDCHARQLLLGNYNEVCADSIASIERLVTRVRACVYLGVSCMTGQSTRSDFHRQKKKIACSSFALKLERFLARICLHRGNI